MKARFWASLACLSGLALVLVSCGKKEETAENAPAGQPAATPIDMSTVGSVSGAVKLEGPAPVPKNNREWNKSQAPGAPDISDTFAREEVAIPVQCQVHPWMKSYIAVFKHPYFAVTGANGSFDIKNLPPGTYTLEAWHEKFGVSDQTVTIGAKEAKTVTFSFKPATGGD